MIGLMARVAADRRELVWGDEFDGPAGSPPDARWWGFEFGDGSAYGNPGWGNEELQTYTDAPANAAFDGRSNLVLTARRAGGGYTSARLVSKGKVELCYGRIEVRARVPRGAGMWSAVWALGADIDDHPWPACGEIDVLEHVGSEPRRAFGTIHGPGYAGSAGYSGGVRVSEDLTKGFHVFAVEWMERALEWSLDDRVYHSATPEKVPGPWLFDHPFYLLVNLAVGGILGGPVSAETAFPQRLLVDYVRVYAPRP
jgi:beta-glucanase (GH16 family)